MQPKNQRTLALYASLCEGKTINKKEEAERFGVDQRSIQRDIDDIRAFLADRRVSNISDSRAVVYDRLKKGFVMTGTEGSDMTNSEILAVSKILLESRAFTKKEITAILNKLVEGCVPMRNMKLVSDLLANEKYHYVELWHKSGIQDKLWELGEGIKEYSVLEISYQKQGDDTDGFVKRIVEPVSLIFSEYYFYLNAYIVEREESGKLVRKYDYPAIFRIDRIRTYRKTGEKFRIAYANRFEEGEFRKRVQFMYPGRLMRLQFRYTGVSVDAVLDRLPTARITCDESPAGKKTGPWIIDAEVYGKGILMWLLSQAVNVEVLKPDTLRDEMRALLRQMLEFYE